MTTTTAPKQTTINLLKKGVPGNYQTAVTRLKEKLGGTIQNDDTPFDIALIATHVGGYEHDWVKSHTSCHYKGAPVTSTPSTPSTSSTASETTTSAPAEAGVLERAATAVVDVAKRVIGGKAVPPVDPSGVITESATATVSISKTDDGRYTGSAHITLTKMQQTMLSDFAATTPEGSQAREVLTKLSTGVIEFNLSAGGDTEG